MTKIFRLQGIKIAVLLLDCLFIYSSYLLAYRIKFHAAGIPQDQWVSFIQYAPWLGLFTVLTYYFFNLYDFAGRQKLSKFLFNLILAHFVFVVELIVLNYWLKTFSLPRSVVIIAFLIQTSLAFGVRILLFSLQTKGIGRKQALVVVNGHHSDVTTLEKVFSKGKVWFDIQRVIKVPNMNVDLPDTVWEGVDVLVLGQGIPPDARNKMIRLAGKQQVEVLLIPYFYELYMMQAEPQQIDDLLVYSMMPPHLSLWEKCAKRTIDLIASCLLLIITSPIMVLMFVLIPRNSNGNALFLQERVGLHEKPFMLMKFRSMVDDAEKSTGPVLATASDARITRLGSFIRATRIDELPQLINVLRGDMSLVGPRPEREFFIAKFREELPHYTYRLMVKPGITGLAQVRANYTTTPSDKLRYDMMYIKNYSPLLDIQILFQTIMVVLQREQSKGVSHNEVSIASLNFDKLLEEAQQEWDAGQGAAEVFISYDRNGVQSYGD